MLHFIKITLEYTYWHQPIHCTKALSGLSSFVKQIRGTLVIRNIITYKRLLCNNNLQIYVVKLVFHGPCTSVVTIVLLILVGVF